VIDLVVCLSIRRGPGVFMDAAMGEHGAFDNKVFRCGKVSHRIIQGNDCVLSPSVISSRGLPLPPTCLLLTVNEVRSYFESTIHIYIN
jgi:hypothetical protein